MDNRIKKVKGRILQVAHDTNEGHIPSAFSILDILYVLYSDVMNVDAKMPEKADRDYLIVSKGHSAIGIYAILEEMGFIDKGLLDTFAKFGSSLGGHPDRNKIPGIEASTGSLGHGLPMAVGMAMGLGYKNHHQRVFCIVGDGELNEGSMWEAIVLAGQLVCSNLICIVDYNHSLDRSIVWGNLNQKIQDFGWDVLSVDGHDHLMLRKALSTDRRQRPLCVIANTIKGKGCSSMEKDPSAWHHRCPNDEELELLLKELSR